VRHRIAFTMFFALPLATGLCLKPAFAQRPCENLAALSLNHATITSAMSYPAGAFKPPSDPNRLLPRAELPAFLPRARDRQAHERFRDQV
jgi:hypothetical protein